MSDDKKTRSPRLGENDVIHFAKDANGKAYGPDNNPRRPGSKAYDMFVLYRDGMTVKEAQAAGIKPVDIRWDEREGRITLERQPKPEKPVKEPKAAKAKKGETAAEGETAAA